MHRRAYVWIYTSRRGAYNMLLEIQFRLIMSLLAVRISLEKPEHTVVTMVRNRDNNTFEILIQHHECPEKYFLHRLQPKEFYLKDGRDVIEETTELCQKCTRCDDGVQVIRECTQYHDVRCGRKCQEPGYRFDEGTKSCQHQKVLDEGFTHAELRQWLAAQNQQSALQKEKSQENLVVEVGSTVKTRLRRTTSTMGDGVSTRVAAEQSPSALPTKAAVDDKSDSDEGSTIETSPVPDVGDVPRDIKQVKPVKANSDDTWAFPHLLLIASASLLIMVIMAYACVAIKKFKPRCLFGPTRGYMRPTSVPVIRAEAGFSSYITRDVPSTSSPLVHIMCNPIANRHLVRNYSSDSDFDDKDGNSEVERNQGEAVGQVGEQKDDDSKYDSADELQEISSHFIAPRTTPANADCSEFSNSTVIYVWGEIHCNDIENPAPDGEEKKEDEEVDGRGDSENHRGDSTCLTSKHAYSQFSKFHQDVGGNEDDCRSVTNETVTTVQNKAKDDRIDDGGDEKKQFRAICRKAIDNGNSHVDDEHDNSNAGHEDYDDNNDSVGDEAGDVGDNCNDGDGIEEGNQEKGKLQVKNVEDGSEQKQIVAYTRNPNENDRINRANSRIYEMTELPKSLHMKLECIALSDNIFRESCFLENVVTDILDICRNFKVGPSRRPSIHVRAVWRGDLVPSGEMESTYTGTGVCDPFQDSTVTYLGLVLLPERTESFIIKTLRCYKLLATRSRLNERLMSRGEVGLTTNLLSSEDIAGHACGPGLTYLVKKMFREFLSRNDHIGVNKQSYMEQLLNWIVPANSSSRGEKTRRSRAKEKSNKEKQTLYFELSI